jgi:predicted MPP superfamily phosphohydrolase
VLVPALALGSITLGTAAVHRITAGYREGIAIQRHRLPWEGASLRVVQLSDVHVGATTPQWMLVRIAQVVSELTPDLVVLTGDYVNLGTFFAGRVTDFVRRLPKPCIATLGNHDHWADADTITYALQRANARVLRNESTTVRLGNEELLVVGVDDGHTGNADIARSFRGVDPARALVLSHFPNTADEIATYGAPLVLSGHTHAGQVDSGRMVEKVARATGNPYLKGFYRIGECTDLYVTAGIGHSLPGLRNRGTCAEISVFDLDPSATARASTAQSARW